MRAALLALATVGLAASVYCCGPKAKPPVLEAPPCPGNLEELCEEQGDARFNCYCPEVAE